MNSFEIGARQEAEKDFHDAKFGGKRKRNYYAWGFTNIVFEDMMDKIGNVEDKKVLEFGCGEGWLTKILASKGAEVWTFDISREAVILAKARMEQLTFKHKVHVDQMAGEKLAYDADMFDVVVGNAILHHIDLQAGMREISRVMKPGGKAFFMEPLGHNPFLNLYRFMTPGKRSRDETPLRFERFSLFANSFGCFEHKEYYLTATFALLWYFLGRQKLMLKTRDILFRLDKMLLRVFKCSNKYCWYSLLTLEK